MSLDVCSYTILEEQTSLSQVIACMVLADNYFSISFVGKVGAFIASIPDVMVAALLCFMWAMLCALGLSNLRYGATGSSRNSIVVGLALFLSLSVPSYFQQYGLLPNTNSSVPTYFQPYNVASHGPVDTGFGGVCTELSIFCISMFYSLLFK